ncbi:MAG TPA: replication initiator protein A [Planctomycetaceae bacterium]|jgi:hypothetical protein|nr:replication initiator protein A [Planctomycetaceae bacterium]
MADLPNLNPGQVAELVPNASQIKEIGSGGQKRVFQVVIENKAVCHQVREIAAVVGMATIWDADVLIWASTQITEALDRGLKPSRKIQFHPYNLLRSIRRSTGGLRPSPGRFRTADPHCGAHQHSHRRQGKILLFSLA